MKIVLLSDLNWEQHLRSISRTEVESVTLETLKKSRYFSIQRYLQIVIDEEAEMVIIAGDVTGDGSCGHGFHHAFMVFLSMLELLKIPSCFISGNHDEQVYYEQVSQFSEGLKYSHEISNKTITINGLKILGVPYETTYSKSKIKNLLNTFQDKYDVVVAHSQLKRRIRLFDLDAQLIITGHYDRKLMGFSGTTFVSLDNDDREISYAFINKQEDGFDTSICIKDAEDVIFRLTESSHKIQSPERSHVLNINNEPTIDLRMLEMHSENTLLDKDDEQSEYQKFIRGVQYLKLLERLRFVSNDKSLRPTLTVMRQFVDMQITANYRVSESLIIDYLGKRTR